MVADIARDIQYADRSVAISSLFLRRKPHADKIDEEHKSKNDYLKILRNRMISDCLFCVICIFATTRTNCWNRMRQPHTRTNHNLQ